MVNLSSDIAGGCWSESTVSIFSPELSKMYSPSESCRYVEIYVDMSALEEIFLFCARAEKKKKMVILYLFQIYKIILHVGIH